MRTIEFRGDDSLREILRLHHASARARGVPGGDTVRFQTAPMQRDPPWRAKRDAGTGSGSPESFPGKGSHSNGTMSNFDSDELRNWATVVAASVALLVFLVNSFLHVRNERLENVSRFIDAHQRLFAVKGYIATNIALIETGSLTRDSADARMEAKFHLMLLEIERLAILANNNAVPRPTQVYMFGWYARTILSVISDQERGNVSWELVIAYLDALASDYTAYEGLTRERRARFWR